MNPFSSSQGRMYTTNVREKIKKRGKHEIQGRGDPAQEINDFTK